MRPTAAAPCLEYQIAVFYPDLHPPIATDKGTHGRLGGRPLSHVCRLPPLGRLLLFVFSFALALPVSVQVDGYA